MPNPPKSLILCVHAHQPVGNFEHIFREAYERSYRPFFEVLERHPSLTAVCHFSGSLLDWIERERPQFLTDLRRLSDRAQIEVLGGAYYEPIYGVIPPNDLAGQIRQMRAKIKMLFGAEPKGAWLTERVWDPAIVKVLAAEGVEYTVLDDFHFKKAGVKSPAGYYRAREGGSSVDVFASAQELRYLLPFRKPEEGVDFIRRARAKEGDALVFADDIEKFGMWPGTYDWVYAQGWLERFFTLLEKEPGVRTTTFGRFRKDHAPKKDVRIPHASYGEMMEWSGGHFGNFFKKYPESLYMRDRMWKVSESIERQSWTNGSAPELVKARQALYRAQCNCTYWHGVFGGLYLHHLRSAVFENLIAAETILRKKENVPAGDLREVSLDSGRRWRLVRESMAAFFNPGYGGALEELDFLPKNINLMCNLRRQREPYHALLAGKNAVSAIHTMLGAKEKDLDKHLFYDKISRLSLMDHFFEAPAAAKDFRQSSMAEAGDFVGAPYESHASEGRLEMRRKGRLRLAGRDCPVELEKTVTASGAASLKAVYRLKNAGHTAISFVHGVEFNFSIGQAGPAAVTEPRVTRHVFHDSWRGIEIELGVSPEASLLTAPVETVSESESGLERTYQGLAVLLQRTFTLAPGQSAETSIDLAVR